VTLISEIMNCYSLKGFIFPKNITTYCGLRSATKLKNVSFRPLSSDSAVRDCTSLNYYTCPSTITQIESYKFQGCNNLSLPSVLPSSIKSISYNAF
jgi:hypothetical protein